MGTSSLRFNVLACTLLALPACRQSSQAPRSQATTAPGTTPSAPSTTPPATALAAPPTGGAGVPTPLAAGGTCGLGGNWAGTLPQSTSPFSQSPVTAEFAAGGIVSWGTRLARFTGTWRVDAGVLHITDTSSTIPQAACPAQQVGRYAVTFTPACDAVTFGFLEDGCDGRRPALTDLHMQRAP